MDFTPIMDGVLQTFPQAAGYLIAAQVFARFVEPLTRRSHSTKLNTILRYVVAFPGTPRSTAPLPAAPQLPLPGVK